MSGAFTVAVELEDGTATIRLRGELDLGGAVAVDDAIAAVPDGTTHLIIDLTELTFVDSAGLGTLIRAKESSEAKARHLQVRGAAGSVRRLIDLVALGESIDLVD